MGAALTYARRYALFTLVGIAGEDDAPDLCAGPTSLSSSTAPQRALQPGHDNSPRREPGNARGCGSTKSKPRVILDPTQSAELREKLLIEVENIASADLASAWAGEALVAKNSLTTADAELVENAFERRLSGLSELPSSDAEALPNDGSSASQIPGPPVIATAKATDPRQNKGIDKSILAVAAPRRYRSREHLRYVMQQPCLICGRKPSDPHHLGFTQPRALGRKVSDEFAVPLCRGHHRAVHRARDERAWWKQAGIDPIKVARKLWKETRLDQPKPNSAKGLIGSKQLKAPSTTQERQDAGSPQPLAGSP
jgi:hypothetical protein